MAYRTNFDQTPPFSVAPRRWWWSRPMMTYNSGCKRAAAISAPFCGGIFTVLVVIFIISFIDKAHLHAKVSLQSLAVSSAATWQGDFLVKNPSSRYSIFYDGEDAAVSLGSQKNVAVLNITSRRVSRSHTAFSLSFVADEGNRGDVVSEELKIRLMGKHKLYTDDDEAGFFNIRCQNVTRGREKIVCESSFTRFNLLILRRPQGARSGGTIGYFN